MQVEPMPRWEAQVSRRKVYDQILGCAGTFHCRIGTGIFECRMGNRKAWNSRHR